RNKPLAEYLSSIRSEHHQPTKALRQALSPRITPGRNANVLKLARRSDNLNRRVNPLWHIGDAGQLVIHRQVTADHGGPSVDVLRRVCSAPVRLRPEPSENS